MTELTLSLAELGGIVLGAVVLAASDPAAVSRMGTAYVGKRLGVDPGEISKYEQATDGDDSS
jgi:hypothetical protein